MRFDASEGTFLSNGLMALLVFLLGLVVGFPAATLGIGFFVDNAVPVVAAMLTVLVLVLVGVGLVIVYRQRIWNAVFRRGQVEAEGLVGPLTDLVRHVVEQKADNAIGSARELGELVVARYAWIMTRRWMLATVTTLVVAIAALAGAALLFQQNQLLRDQSELLAQQNDRIAEQTTLLEAQIQLGEAQRSTAIVPEILAIGAAIGEETTALAANGRTEASFAAAELSDALRARIVAATNTARPYRHAQSPLSELSETELTAAAVARRGDLPGVLAQYDAVQAQQPGARPLAELGVATGELTDRESSPERGQLISLLYNSGIRDTEVLTYAGADFSFAELRQPTLADMSFRHAMLRFADFSRIQVRNVDFRGGLLDHIRFRGSRIVDSDFSALAAAEVQAPFAQEANGAATPSQLHGADFTSAFVYRTGYRGAWMVAADFDAAFVGSVDFTNTDLSAATFRGAVIYDSTFEGAQLGSVDLERAIVFAPDFLEALAAASATAEDGTHSFVAARWRLEPISLEELAEHPQIGAIVDELPDGGAALAGLTPYRIVRVGEFETMANPAGGIIPP